MTAQERLSPTVLWTVESQSVWIVDTATGRNLRLLGAEAVLWDLLCRPAPASGMRELFSAITGKGVEETDLFFLDRQERWRRMGLLRKEFHV